MRVRRLAWGLLGLCVGLTAAGLVFAALNRGSAASQHARIARVRRRLQRVFLAFPIVGALIATRQPRNAIGWLFLTTGLGRAVDFAFLGYATHTLVEAPGSLPGGALAALVADLAWVPSLLAATALLFLLFPHGRLPSRRWRPCLGDGAGHAGRARHAVRRRARRVGPDSAHRNPLAVGGSRR